MTDDYETWERELKGAGWIKVSATVWRDPKGREWRGPFGAWTAMRAMRR